jgi:plastocyanin
MHARVGISHPAPDGRAGRSTAHRVIALLGTAGMALLVWGTGAAPGSAAQQAGRWPERGGDRLQASLAPVVVAAQTPPGTAQPAPAEGDAIHIENFAFAPATIKVAPGTTVVWTNGDAVPHTSTSKDKFWDSHPILPGSTFKVTFDKVGTYTYQCSIHPFMQATVVVGN